MPNSFNDDTTLPHEPFAANIDWHERDRAAYARAMQERDEYAAACRLLRAWRDKSEHDLERLRAETIRFLERTERGQSNTGASAPVQGE